MRFARVAAIFTEIEATTSRNRVVELLAELLGEADVADRTPETATTVAEILRLYELQGHRAAPSAAE